MQKLLPFLLLLLLAGKARTQSVVSIVPDHYLESKRGGLVPVPLFLPGKDGSFLAKGKKQPRLKLPASPGQSGFSYLSCGFLNPEYVFENGALLYFVNLGTAQTCIYVDRNFNYDYTDDGKPVYADAAGTFTVSLSSPADTMLHVMYRYTLLSSKTDITTFPKELFTGNSFYEGTTLIDVKYWMSADILWIKGMNTVCGGDSLCVVLTDADLDGCFTGKGDQVALCNYGTDSAWTDQYHGARTMVPGLILAHDGRAFEIRNDTSGCRSVTLKYRSDLEAPVSLKPGDALPHFSLRFMNGDSADIYTRLQAGKYTYIDFWGTWCAGCVSTIPQLQKLNAEKTDALVIISVDARDEREKAKKFTAEKNMSWPQAFSNANAENSLYAGDVFPYGILVGPDGKIIAFNVGVRELSGLIK